MFELGLPGGQTTVEEARRTTIEDEQRAVTPELGALNLL
jgi:hypothetical protein